MTKLIETQLRTLFHGIVLPTLTYYNDDLSIDWESTLDNIEYVLNNGLTWDNSCLLVGGAGGDFPSLTVEEREELMRRVYNHVGGRVPVGASIQDTNVDVIVRLAKEAVIMGLDYVQISPTYYYESSFEDFIRVLDAVVTAAPSLNLLIYNTPWENVVDLNCQQIGVLINRYPQFMGLKWGTNHSNDEYLNVIRTYKDQIQIIDNQNMHVMTYMLGGVGHISHYANIYPEHDIKLYTLLRGGKYEEAQKHINRHNQPWRKFRLYMWDRSALESPTVKMALNITGRPGNANNVRLPSRPLENEERTMLQNLLNEIGQL